MIRQINEDEVNLIEQLLAKFGQETNSTLPPNFADRIKSSVTEGRAIAYGAFHENSNLIGIGLFGNVTKRIPFVYAEGNQEVENQLIDVLFNNHSSDCSYIGVAGSWVTEGISKWLIQLGFRKIDRAYMTLDRISIETLENPLLDENIKFEVYDSSQIVELSKLMFKGNDGHIDQIVFPNFFESVETCKALIEAIENDVYGEYKESYSWLLRENNQLIGACLLPILNKGDTGYIPDIVIDPDFQGKGFGKAIMTHSLKTLLSSESGIVKCDLDVTLENNARFLYKSLGYEIVREYSMYTWLNKKND